MTSPGSPLGDAQRSRLARAKLRALVRGAFGERDWVEEDVGGLAGLHDGHDGFVLVQDGWVGLGRSLLWADKLALSGDLHLLADAEAGAAARRARLVSRPVTVWQVSGTTLVEAAPAEHLPVVPPAEDALVAAEPLRQLGAVVIAEHGVVMAEVLGLEVGRVVRVEGSAEPVGAGAWALEIGVGKNDRAASVMMDAVNPRDDGPRVIELVRSHRRPDTSPHLLNRLSRPRWLREQVLADPALVGAASLAHLEPPRPRENLVEPAPALALGLLPDGGQVVVGCSVGVDLEALVTLADARDRHAPDAEAVFVTPGRDQYPPVRRLADLLLPPARLVPVEGDWPR